MSLKNALNEYNELREKKEKYDTFVVDSANYISTANTNPQASGDYEKVVRFVAMSMKNMSNAYYKTSTFLDTQDVEQIKSALNNYIKADLKDCSFKKSIMEDLTDIQNKIKTKHIQKQKDLENEKTACERQAKVLEFAKSKLIMDRLSKIQWPYDSKTQEYENQIQKLIIKAEKSGQKLEELKKMRPVADEKDILIYQMNIKEKYLAN